MTSVRGVKATDLAREASGHVDALYVFGGDGTFNEVLNGIAGMTPIGFIPGGGTSPLPGPSGFRTIPLGPRRRSRIARRMFGRVNGRRFGFACGIGLDAEVVRAVDELGRRSDGRRPNNMTFAWTGLGTLGRYRFRLEPSLEVMGHGRAAFVLISNGPAYSYAGRVPVRPAPHARLRGRARPGGADSTADPRASTIRVVRVRPRMPDEGAEPPVRARCRSNRDRCDAQMPLQVDGEDLLGDVDQVRVEARARCGHGPV